MKQRCGQQENCRNNKSDKGKTVVHGKNFF
jgi:hypothetical protein